MIIIGANSDVSRSFIELVLSKEKFTNIYLVSSNPDRLGNYKKHLKVKYEVNVELIELDLTNPKPIDYSKLDYELVFCASGYMGETEDATIENNADNSRILNINYSNLVLTLNYIAMDLIVKGKGTIIGMSSVAGERGRKKNFIYGSAKAGFTAYLSGLRNYLYKQNIHVMTVKPGFMYTQMTENLDLPKPLTITSQKAAKLIYRGYRKRRNVIYIGWIWRWIMLVIKLIPESIFKKLSI